MFSFSALCLFPDRRLSDRRFPELMLPDLHKDIHVPGPVHRDVRFPDLHLLRPVHSKINR